MLPQALRKRHYSLQCVVTCTIVLALVSCYAAENSTRNDSNVIRSRRAQYESLNPSESISLSTLYQNIDDTAKSDSNQKTSFICPSRFGHYRDASNCAAYYICSFGISLPKNCSSGLYFSERLQICDWPSNVPCEQDFASLNAETSVYNLVDEPTSTAIPLISEPKLKIFDELSLSSIRSHTAAQAPSLTETTLPKLDDTLALYSSTEQSTTTTISPLYSDLYSTTQAPTPVLANTVHAEYTTQPDTNVHKHASSQYVVDGFEVPATTPHKAFDSDSSQSLFRTNNQTKELIPSRNSPPSFVYNSTFLEVSKMNNSAEQDRTFKKRNDFDPFWSGINFEENSSPRVNPFSRYNEPRSTYYRHSPQGGSLMLTNSNPYMPKLANHHKPQTVAPYFSPDNDENRQIPTYRSRYQHRYKQPPQSDQTLIGLPKMTANKLPTSYRHLQYQEPTRVVNTEPVPTLYTTKPNVMEAQSILQKTPDVYIEVIPSDNFSAPYLFETKHKNQESPLFIKPMNRLNYEINERLLAPFKQREFPSRANWLDKPASSSEKRFNNGHGVNRYSNYGNLFKPGRVTSRPTSSGQFRKKVIRKKKMNQPTSALAASSSTNLYGHTSTHLLTGAMMSQPFMLDRTRINSRPPISSNKVPSVTSTNFAPKLANNKINHVSSLRNEWKPVNILTNYPSTTTTTTTIAPLLDSYLERAKESGLPNLVKQFMPKEHISTQRNRPQSANIGNVHSNQFINYQLVGENKNIMPVMQNHNTDHYKAKEPISEQIASIEIVPIQAKFSLGNNKPPQLNAAQYNRYIVLSPNASLRTNDKHPNNRHIAQTVTTAPPPIAKPPAILVYDSVRILPTTTTRPTTPSSNMFTTQAPIRESLEVFIKKEVDKSSQSVTTSQPRSTTPANLAYTHKATLVHAISNFLGNQSSSLSGDERPPKESIKPINAYRQARRYRPLITLEQKKSTKPIQFSSKRIISPTPISIPIFSQDDLLGTKAKQESIDLHDPASITVYKSPPNNDVSHVRVNETHFSWPPYELVTAKPVSGEWGKSETPTSTPLTTTTTMTTTLAPTTVSIPTTEAHKAAVDDIQTNFIQTLSATSTTKTPRVSIHKSNVKQRHKSRPWQTSLTYSTTTTTRAPEVSTRDNYDDEYDYGDYDESYESDYNDLSGNRTEAKSISNSTPIVTTTTTTTTTTTAATTTRRTTPLPAYRRKFNPTSKPLIYLTNKPRPTKKRLIIKSSSENEAIKLASRPQPLYPQPKALVSASKCDKRKCRLPDCRCGGSDVPGNLPNKQIPQLVMLTFDDGVNDLNWELYEELLNRGRKNPNGCPIKATFYVSHEWTDYGQVQTLYSRGHEIASHTISHRFGEKFSKEEWIKEINGQREILNLYGGVRFEDIRGMRAPFLQTGGNNMFEMLYETNFTYDSSLPVQENSPPYWPYTLDYALSHSCNIPPCPTKSFPGVWEVGMVMWSDLRGGRCSMGDACTNPADEDGVYEMLMKNFNRHYKSNRAPFSLYYHSAWFNTQHHKKGFIKFLDEITQNPDVYMVTTWQALQWVREPTPISKMADFEPFQCKASRPVQECSRPKACNVSSKQGSRTLRTCQECPSVYPWIGNTGFSKAKYG